MAEKHKKPAVFLDRDGVINRDNGSISSMDEIHIFPYTKDCIKELHKLGYYVIVVSNQGGVAKGILTENALIDMNDQIKRETGVDKIYYCPYLIDGIVEKYKKHSHSRKPDIGMIEQACAEFDIDMTNSIMVGDRAVDIETGQNAGLPTVLLESGFGTKRLERTVNPDYILNDLRDVVELCRQRRRKRYG